MTTRPRLVSATVRMGVVALLVLAPLALSAQDTARVTIAGLVRSASGTHTVYVAIWNDSGFLKTPVQQVRIDAGHEPRFTFIVPRGRWAISAYEDRNEDGKLNIGWFGPREPNGFWRAFHGHHKPRFDEVGASVDGNVADVIIDLAR